MDDNDSDNDSDSDSGGDGTNRRQGGLVIAAVEIGARLAYIW